MLILPQVPRNRRSNRAFQVLFAIVLFARFQSQAGVVVGPFVPGSGHWTTVPGGDFEFGPQTIPPSPGTHGVYWLNSSIAAGTAKTTSAAAVNGGFGVDIVPTINFNGAGMGVLSTGVAVTSGQTYVISAFVKRLNPQTSPARIYLDLWTPPIATAQTNSTEWQFIYGTFVANGNLVYPRLVIDSMVSTADEIYADDVSVTPASTFVPPTPVNSPDNGATNAIVGPFAAGTGSWTTVPHGDFEFGPTTIQPSTPGGIYWGSASGTSGVARTTSSSAYDGNLGVDIAPSASFNGAGMTVISSGVPVTNGATYFLSAFVKRLNPLPSPARIYLDLWGPPLFLALTNTTEWQFVYGSFVANGSMVYPRIVIDQQVTPADEFFADDLSITPSNTFSPPMVAGPGVTGPAFATARVDNGFVVQIDVTSGGFGYSTPPTVLILGGGGSGASATAKVTNGNVVAITITNPGTGYTNAPVVALVPPNLPPSKVSVSVETVRVSAALLPGAPYVLQSSTNGVTWINTAPVFVATTNRLSQDFDVSDGPAFFRVISPTGP
jgi:hypothetical protein